jgi:hypothetical protein
MDSGTEGTIVLYQTDNDKVTVNVHFEDETFWLTQKAMAELFDVQVPAIAKHLKNIFDEEEMDSISTVSRKEMLRMEGGRKVRRSVEFYRLYPIVNALRSQLNWSQYHLLISIDDDYKREYYELEAVNNGWTCCEMERQINAALYERLLLNLPSEETLLEEIKDVLDLAESGEMYE